MLARNIQRTRLLHFSRTIASSPMSSASPAAPASNPAKAGAESSVFDTAPQHSLFQKIIDRKIPSKVVYEDDRAMAFRDIHPQAPIHVVIISKELKIGRVHERATGDESAEKALGHLMLVAGRVAQIENLVETGYRLVVNQGVDACQSVNYLHVHLIGGRPLGWPPG